MKISVEDYKKFYGLLNMISSLSADVQIYNNKICQTSNSNTYLIYADLSPLLTDNNIESIYLYTLENKLPILKLFNEATAEHIDFISDKESKSYIVSDGISDISIRYSSTEENNGKYRIHLYKSLDDYDKIAEISFDKMLLKRLVAAGRALNADVLNFSSSDNKGCLFLEDPSKNKKMKLISNIETSLNCNVVMNYDCFKTAMGESATLSIYKSKTSSTGVVKITTEIAGCSVEYRQNRKVPVIKNAYHSLYSYI